MSKFEKLLDLLVNEQKDEAEKLFHEIVVEKSRSIYEGILADEEAEATEESADQDDADEVVSTSATTRGDCPDQECRIAVSQAKFILRIPPASSSIHVATLRTKLQ